MHGVLILGALVVVLVLIPDLAQAWGPITHLTHGSEILKNLTIVGGALQQLLQSHAYHYLYGCVGADITIGKKYTRAMQAHCHSWEVGWQLVETARSDAERAFAYGYLSHLAADVISHNHYVPTQLVVSFRTSGLRHIFWEACFDTMQANEGRRLVSEIRRRHFPDCDALLQKVVARTLFSFDTNKRLFNSFLAFHDWRNWHRIMERATRRSREALPRGIVFQYNALIYENICDLLQNGKQAACQAQDPTGLAVLRLAQDVRRTLKALARRGALTDEIERQIVLLNQRRDLRVLQSGADALLPA